ncbi:MAG: hypothetical protein U1F54_12095 [Burkholderiales bacterium]
MKVSAQITFAMSVAFALLCLGYGAYGWHELAGMPPGPERDDAHGYVFFWGFLGAIGAISAAISWRMMRARED